jgi:spermidine synthase
VPSFGEWGFILAAPGSIPTDVHVLPGRFLDAATERRLFDFPPDMAQRAAPVNRLDDQALVRIFDEEWSRYEG